MSRFGIVAALCLCLCSDVFAKDKTLKSIYEHHSQTPSDIYEHIPVLRELAAEGSSAIEIGVRSLVSTWGILQGLSENGSPYRFYVGIDIAAPPAKELHLARTLSEKKKVEFQFIQANDMLIDLPPVDFLFIDSLHTYCHLTYELEKFSPQVAKYIAMHDTSAPWEDTDDTEYQGDYSEYPAWMDRSKRGLWPAVEDFLSRHPEWVLHKRYTNCHGLTVLKRL